ncbi:maltase A2-like isoform X2 [Venturia canescens]|uniref:maltase A2-like isoform X2 n=1 Tax=Venturia canescens TaxID=32260 RepID=UPI001C9BC96D|nr:maltase A2-like isoform X2 [Venturia canescens]
MEEKEMCEEIENLTVRNTRRSVPREEEVEIEPSSRDPMVESSSSEESSVNNEPVCTQLLTQLNTAYQHLAPDAQAIFYNQENGGKPPLVPIQLMVPKPPKDYNFMRWNWPRIRKVSFWFMVFFLGLCTALAIRGIVIMPRRCDPEMEWWQGNLFYEIFPASFQDSSKEGHGIGDLRGITMRLDYLKDLGVKGVRLNSIFRSEHYPENYGSITSLTLIDENLGSLEDFDSLVSNLHSRNMSLILDLPLYPFVKSLAGGTMRRTRNENNETLSFRDKRENDDGTTNSTNGMERETTIVPDVATSLSSGILTTLIPQPIDFSSTNLPNLSDSHQEAYSASNYANPKLDEHMVTAAIRYWIKKGVDGFYLKGLKNYLKDENFVELLNDWRTVADPQKIFISDWESLEAAEGPARDTLFRVLDLVDVNLRISNGTKDIKSQIERVTKSTLFDRQRSGQPWVQWSIGGLDKPRIASTLKVSNASAAVTLLGMMLPGTPNIFYGDEIGMTNCDCKDHQELKHLQNLSPMYWEAVAGSTENFSSQGVVPWLPVSMQPAKSDMARAVPEMAKLRRATTPIFVEAAAKHDSITANLGIRYSEDELIVIERWYPRQNSYVYIANLGKTRQTKDLSSLYYDGHVVVGPPRMINQDIFFKRLSVAPGEAYVIKLDK